MAVVMRAPSDFTAGNSVTAPVSGTTYTTDTNNYLSVVADVDVDALVARGFVVMANLQRNNYAQGFDPTPSSDNTLDYGIGSKWQSGTSGQQRLFECLDASTGAAIWHMSSPSAVQFRNLVIGGDFTINPWQRDIPGIQASSGVSNAISNTLTYFPDAWAAIGGASSSIVLSKASDAGVAGFTQALKWQRTASNSNTAAFWLCHSIESKDMVRLPSLNLALSFWAKAGANYSGGNLSVQVWTGTGTDEGTAALQAGSWTGALGVISTTQAISSSWVRYRFNGAISGSPKELGILFSWTPSGTAGSDDSIYIQGIQLENAGCATPFEHRGVHDELRRCQRRAWVIAEPAASVVVAAGSVSASNTEIWAAPTPVTMRVAPAVTTAAGSFKSNSATAGVVAATSLAGNANHTANCVGLTASGTGTAGQAALLQGGGGSGWILASADL